MKKDLMDTLEKMAAGLRQELERNDGSTLQAISSNLKQGYESVKGGIESNERARKILDGIKENMEEASKAIVAGDRKLSAKALEALEKRIREYRDKQEPRNPASDDEIKKLE